MAKSKKNADQQDDSANQPPKFEESLSRLDEIVSNLESGSLSLEEALQEFEQGVGLLRNCYGLLEQAEQRVNMLLGFDDDGNPVVTPFDASATADQAKQSGAGRRKKKKTSSETSSDVDESDDIATEEDDDSTLF
ncbi:MAG: hypothetical protein Tsb009_30130 [Planctomycetaceae bacterium]